MSYKQKTRYERVRVTIQQIIGAYTHVTDEKGNYLELKMDAAKPLRSKHIGEQRVVSFRVTSGLLPAVGLEYSYRETDRVKWYKYR